MRLVRLVEDMTRLAKAEAAHLKFDRENVDLAEIIEEVLALDEPQFEARALTVESQLDPMACRVLGDRDKLFQILRNIVQNALRYSREGGKVTLSSGREGGAVRVTVTNEGEAIAKEDLPHIFERFYRADKSRSRKSGGAGIGLAIVKELVEVHGGKTGATSDHGRTSIWFSLPIAKDLRAAE